MYTVSEWSWMDCDDSSSMIKDNTSTCISIIYWGNIVHMHWYETLHKVICDSWVVARIFELFDQAGTPPALIPERTCLDSQVMKLWHLRPDYKTMKLCVVTKPLNDKRCLHAETKAWLTLGRHWWLFHVRWCTQQMCISILRKHGRKLSPLWVDRELCMSWAGNDSCIDRRLH